jgi:hypothetical protein
MPPPQARPTAPAVRYGDPLAKFPRGNDEELRVVVNAIDGTRYIDLRIWFLDAWGRWKPTERHMTIRGHELLRLVEVLRVAAKAIGAVVLAKAPAPTESEAALRARLAAELKSTIADLRPELEAAVARGDAAAVLAAFDDLAVLIHTTGG